MTWRYYAGKGKTMGASSGTIDLDKLEIEPVQKFYEWLQGGDSPEAIHFKHKLRLTADEAFSIVYYLQEELGILPDRYEKCRECGELYDSYNEGVSIDKDTTIIDDEGNEVDGNFTEELYGMYCDSCRPD